MTRIHIGTEWQESLKHTREQTQLLNELLHQNNLLPKYKQQLRKRLNSMFVQTDKEINGWNVAYDRRVEQKKAAAACQPWRRKFQVCYCMYFKSISSFWWRTSRVWVFFNIVCSAVVSLNVYTCWSWNAYDYRQVLHGTQSIYRMYSLNFQNQDTALSHQSRQYCICKSTWTLTKGWKCKLNWVTLHRMKTKCYSLQQCDKMSTRW